MEMATLIGQVGFPIAITAFVLVRLEGTVNKNTMALYAIKEVMEKCSKRK